MEFWRKIFGESESAAPRKGPKLSPETQRRVNLLFRPEEQNIVATSRRAFLLTCKSAYIMTDDA
jgi:hypothetical protein